MKRKLTGKVLIINEQWTPVNMPDPIRKRFGYGQLWPLLPESARSEMPNLTSRVSFILVFFKEGMDHIVQNRTGSDLDGLVRVWPKAFSLEASRCTGIIGPGFWQDATRFRSSTDAPDNIVQNQPGSDATSFPLSDSVPFFHRRPG